MFDGKSVLITGGTGSFGHKYTQPLLSCHKSKKMKTYSLDKLKKCVLYSVMGLVRSDGFLLQSIRCVSRLIFDLEWNMAPVFNTVKCKASFEREERTLSDDVVYYKLRNTLYLLFEYHLSDLKSQVKL